MDGGLKIFSGLAHPDLAKRIASAAGMHLSAMDIRRFSDGEISVAIDENARGVDAFVIQPTFAPAENIMELLLICDALKRASARRVTAVIPYFGYARQDRKDRPRVAISAKVMANLIAVSGVDRVLTMDLHSSQIQGFFDIPVDHLYAARVLVRHFAEMRIPDLVVVSPDIGSVKMARAYAKRLNAGLAVIDKRRPKANAVEVYHVIGDVENKNVLLVDDLIDTAGTVVAAIARLREEGAKEIYGAITHAVLSGPAIDRLGQSEIKELVVTDSLPLRRPCDKIKVLSVAGLLGEAIQRIHREESVSSLFVE
ncbi:MAG: ribose-phosphate pyrophosphokinase [Candidatus Latescibacterota bacterium]|nr:MAG: ribose-phosphate pyrophosphokinase [Candidatus Latescibacterota bacterium]